ncbi:MAG: hypothetical protein HDQ88_05015 [Clostridia bacterium]|nr:hypothetical protein [Clostridia bacterium]
MNINGGGNSYEGFVLTTNDIENALSADQADNYIRLMDYLYSFRPIGNGGDSKIVLALKFNIPDHSAYGELSFNIKYNT